MQCKFASILLQINNINIMWYSWYNQINLEHMPFLEKKPKQYEQFNYTLIFNRSVQCFLFYKIMQTVSYPCSIANKDNFLTKNACQKNVLLTS